MVTRAFINLITPYTYTVEACTTHKIKETRTNSHY